MCNDDHGAQVELILKTNDDYKNLKLMENTIITFTYPFEPCGSMKSIIVNQIRPLSSKKKIEPSKNAESNYKIPLFLGKRKEKKISYQGNNIKKKLKKMIYRQLSFTLR